MLFFPQSYSVYGMDVTEDAIVLVKARVNARDDRVSLIANDLVVPDLSSIGVDKPLQVVIPTRLCTPDKIGELKRVLSRHPGTADVHIKHVGSRDRHHQTEGGRQPARLAVLGLDGRPEGLLGPGCLAG
nr:hypothetical protein [Nocardia tengchongensis]